MLKLHVLAALAGLAAANKAVLYRDEYVYVNGQGLAFSTSTSSWWSTSYASTSTSSLLTPGNVVTTLVTVRAGAAAEAVASSSAVTTAAASVLEIESPAATLTASTLSTLSTLSVKPTLTTAAATTSTSLASSSETGIYSEIASSTGVDVDFAKSMLDRHNVLRAAHSAGALSWSSTLYAFAQAYADQYVCGSSLVHSGGPYGENLAAGYSTGVAALNAWYAEGDNYDYSTATLFDHFTQVIWKGTTELGCAYKLCTTGAYPGLYVICSYNPPGNYIGQGKANLASS